MGRKAQKGSAAKEDPDADTEDVALNVSKDRGDGTGDACKQHVKQYVRLSKLQKTLPHAALQCEVRTRDFIICLSPCLGYV